MTASHQPRPQEADAHPVTKTVDDARQGMETGHMRWVLRISVALAIVAMAVAFIVVFATHH